MTADIPILEMERFIRRLRQEAERSLRGGAKFSLFCVACDNPEKVSEEEMRHCLTRSVRLVDTIGRSEENQFVFIFPEIGETATIPSSRILDSLIERRIKARGGLGIFPEDGADPEILLSMVRETAQSAAVGHLANVVADATVMEIDGQPVIAADVKTKRLFALVKSLAKSNLPVLIGGETGVGKEIIARALHTWSPRQSRKIVSINCAAMPETLLESELFGHEKGAFSGAIVEKKGLFEIAEGGTLFLDEISEASLRVQAGLLRVLETKKVRRVGAVNEKAIDVRIVSATNRDLEKDIKTGRFRRDLYFRLCAATVSVPKLRRRIKDLPELSKVFLDRACQELHQPPKTLAPETLDKLTEYTWPGNVRELKHLMEYLAATVQGEVIEPEALPRKILTATGTIVVDKNLLLRQDSDKTDLETDGRPVPMRNLSDEIQELERQRIKEALLATDGVRSRAAEMIGMPLRTLVSKIKRYGLSSIKSNSKRSKKRTGEPDS